MSRCWRGPRGHRRWSAVAPKAAESLSGVPRRLISLPSFRPPGDEDELTFRPVRERLGPRRRPDWPRSASRRVRRGSGAATRGPRSAPRHRRQTRRSSGRRPGFPRPCGVPAVTPQPARESHAGGLLAGGIKTVSAGHADGQTGWAAADQATMFSPAPARAREHRASSTRSRDWLPRTVGSMSRSSLCPHEGHTLRKAAK